MSEQFQQFQLSEIERLKREKAQAELEALAKGPQSAPEPVATPAPESPSWDGKTQIPPEEIEQFKRGLAGEDVPEFSAPSPMQTPQPAQKSPLDFLSEAAAPYVKSETKQADGSEWQGAPYAYNPAPNQDNPLFNRMGKLGDADTFQNNKISTNDPNFPQDAALKTDFFTDRLRINPETGTLMREGQVKNEQVIEPEHFESKKVTVPTPTTANTQVGFGHNERKLSPNEQQKLKDFVTEYQKNPEAVLHIKGRASAPGSNSYNMKISQDRANNVEAAALAAGIPASAIKKSWVGENEANPRATAEQQAADRETQFEVKYNKPVTHIESSYVPGKTSYANVQASTTLPIPSDNREMQTDNVRYNDANGLTPEEPMQTEEFTDVQQLPDDHWPAQNPNPEAAPQDPEPQSGELGEFGEKPKTLDPLEKAPEEPKKYNGEWVWETMPGLAAFGDVIGAGQLGIGGGAQDTSGVFKELAALAQSTAPRSQAMMKDYGTMRNNQFQDYTDFARGQDAMLELKNKPAELELKRLALNLQSRKLEQEIAMEPENQALLRKKMDIEQQKADIEKAELAQKQKMQPQELQLKTDKLKLDQQEIAMKTEELTQKLDLAKLKDPRRECTIDEVEYIAAELDAVDQGKLAEQVRRRDGLNGSPLTYGELGGLSEAIKRTYQPNFGDKLKSATDLAGRNMDIQGKLAEEAAKAAAKTKEPKDFSVNEKESLSKAVIPIQGKNYLVGSQTPAARRDLELQSATMEFLDNNTEKLVKPYKKFLDIVSSGSPTEILKSQFGMIKGEMEASAYSLVKYLQAQFNSGVLNPGELEMFGRLSGVNISESDKAALNAKDAGVFSKIIGSITDKIGNTLDMIVTDSVVERRGAKGAELYNNLVETIRRLRDNAGIVISSNLRDFNPNSKLDQDIIAVTGQPPLGPKEFKQEFARAKAHDEAIFPTPVWTAYKENAALVQKSAGKGGSVDLDSAFNEVRSLGNQAAETAKNEIRKIQAKQAATPAPTRAPTVAPQATRAPTVVPTAAPTRAPTAAPTVAPIAAPAPTPAPMRKYKVKFPTKTGTPAAQTENKKDKDQDEQW